MVVHGDETTNRGLNKAGLFVQAVTGKWVVLGVLVAGFIRIIVAVAKGTSIVNAIGIAVVGTSLAFATYIIVHRGSRR